MTDDLVKRLHKGPLRDDYETAVTMSEAADRIAKLEAALDDMAQYISRADWHYLKDETRKALEGEDDPAS